MPHRLHRTSADHALAPLALKTLRRPLPWLLLAALTLAGCGKEKAVSAPPPPPEVAVLTVTQQATPLSIEIVAEVKALREVELRPRVSGLVIRQNFRPGQSVKEGDLLFVIDPRPYDEAVTTAQANLAEAQANLARVRQDVERYKPLLKDNAIPRQTYEQTVAQEQQTQAVADARRSSLDKARLERSFAEVRSPISGQIGLQKVEVGGLASAGQTVLATVSTLDPVAAYFSIAEVDYLAFAKRIGSARAGNGERKSPPTELVLADGSLYDQPGQIDFADRALNPASGTLTLRALFANPQDLLRPGMSARVRIVYDVAEKAILVPQKAITEMLGKQFATVVGADNKVQQRPVTTGARLGEQWLIEAGLQPGEVVVVEGLQKARPGTTVRPVPLTPPTPTAPAAAGSAAPAASAPAGGASARQP
jgi:membrane fusion protein (multidrug efflux system)